MSGRPRAERREVGSPRAERREVGSPGARAGLTFCLVACAGSVGLVLALLAVGTNIVATRYLSLAHLLEIPLLAAVVTCVPGRLVAAALAAWLVLGSAATVTDGGRLETKLAANWGQEWDKAGAALDALRPAPDEPVLLWTGFVEADLVGRPGRLDTRLRGFLCSPLADRPGRPEDDPFRFGLLTYRWNVPGQPEHFEREIVPRLARCRRFFVVAHPGYLRELEQWLAARFPETFARRFTSREYVAPVVVSQFDRR